MANEGGEGSEEEKEKKRRFSEAVAGLAVTSFPKFIPRVIMVFSSRMTADAHNPVGRPIQTTRFRPT
jgi:hypothetical protein